MKDGYNLYNNIICIVVDENSNYHKIKIIECTLTTYYIEYIDIGKTSRMGIHQFNDQYNITEIIDDPLLNTENKIKLVE